MRRKSFDILFEPKNGMGEVATNPSMVRSLAYFLVSIGAFDGVCINTVFSEQELPIRFALLIGAVLVHLVGLIIFTCFLHGVVDAYGETFGNVRGLLCAMGFTVLPYLVFTPVALLGVKLGVWGTFILVPVILLAALWTTFLMIRAIQAVYLISFMRAMSVMLFALLLVACVTIVPAYLCVKMLAFGLF